MSSPELLSPDDILKMARDVVVTHQKGSISLVQRHLKIRYNLAAQLLEQLEVCGVVGPMGSNGVRVVRVKS